METKVALRRMPMLAKTTKLMVVADHKREIETLVSLIVKGDSLSITRLIDIHLSMAIHYVRRLAARYEADVDVVMSNYMMGMFDACLKFQSGEAVPTNASGYIFSCGKSAAINGLENPATGWNRENYRVSKAKGRFTPAVAHMPDDGMEISAGSHPIYIDQGVDIMVEAEDLMKSLTATQQQAIVAFARGCDDKEVARELGWSTGKVGMVKSEIIAIMESRVFRGNNRRRIKEQS